jgi:uncharacterized protein YwqG
MSRRPFRSALAAVLGLFGRSKEDPEVAPALAERHESVTEALAANDFGRIAEAVLAGQRTAIALEARDGETLFRSGSSRIGGRPDLPPSASWPQAEGTSLAFIAQIDLAEVAGVWSDSPLPASGTLAFFYQAEQSVWGFDPKDGGKWAVLHWNEAPELLEERAFPADLPDSARFEPKAVAPVAQAALPDTDHIDLRGFGLSRKEEDRVVEIFGAFTAEEAPMHKLFGYPDPIQGDMQLECQLVSHGLYCGDETGYNDPRAAELRAGAGDWRLLLQIDSDDDTGMMWGDLGRIYYWIREQDLAERAFDRAWLILQCT